MRKYLVDINIISYLADADSPFHERVRKSFRALGKDDIVALSVLGLYEFYCRGPLMALIGKFSEQRKRSAPSYRSSP
jgi:predicted nucleic acid-binding protein